MVYLESFSLPTWETEERILGARAAENGGIFGYIDNPYPCGLFPQKQLSGVTFAATTVFYGGNGSGKSTLINLISEKLALNRIAPYNSGEMFQSFVNSCAYELGYDDEGFKNRIPSGSRIITSDDIFDYMLAVRADNLDRAEKNEEARQWRSALRREWETPIQLKGMEDYEQWRVKVLARRRTMTRRDWLKIAAGEETELESNGETALRYFEQKLKNDTLYCLDEPENSMSPKMQQELVEMLQRMAHYCGCQFIIATHSPFLLALDNARIYDLDASPVDIKPWWELENTRLYYEFFKKHRRRFEGE